ncbi:MULTISPECIES: SusC/RagA family TonB-linked outer membrane protein [unclassified Carboxylicivirga]|uniref:SusC/RagA family TonB-linked outer membrane protein n=1 Tax=Carboxylicivirga TaxID=1628153 RepID=UPI003D3557D4
MKHVLGIFLFLLALTGQAQNLTVSGTVNGTDGLPVPGVSVVVKGTSIGTVTNIDGIFTLEAGQGDVLVFSFIGMRSQEVPVTSSTINIIMEEELTDLDEVVVIGYGVQKKSVVTAAISSVSAESLEAATPSRIEDVLKGRVSGVQITQSSGQPGSDSKVRIRGIGTINNSEPLYIVDGMAVDGGINYLNPSDIESIEVLKDAASAAIYGARAANGVILVSTKSGKSGKMRISYDFSYGWQNPWTKKAVLDATEYMVLMNETNLNDGLSPIYSSDEIAAAGKGTDWQDETFNYDAPIQNHQVSLSGGSDNVNYFVSFGYFDQDGIVGGNYGRSNYERYSVRSNTTYDVFKQERALLSSLKVGVNAAYSRITSMGIDTNSEFGSVLGSALAMSPLVPVYATDPDAVLADYPNAVKDADGRVFSLPPSGFQEIANPVAMLNAPTYSQGNSDKFVSTFWGEVDVYKGIRFKTSYGADLAFWGDDGYTYPHYLSSQGKNIVRSNVSASMNRGYTWQIENTLSYANTIDDKHNFSVLLGQSAREYKMKNLGGVDYDLLEYIPHKSVIDYAIGDPDDERVNGGTDGVTSRTLASYFGRVDYNFDERYMFQASIRRDGSSRFGANNKWATFPSASVGWNLTNESFMEGRPHWFDYLKIRASWGRNGNEQIGDFAYTSLMDGNQNYYFGIGDNENLQYGTSPQRIPNPDVIWEESEQIDIGFDLRLLKSRLAVGFDYFRKDTEGMLMEQPIPNYVGTGKPIANVGDMRNSGVEIELSWKDNVGGFTYGISANASYLKNELINLGNESGEIFLENAFGIGDFVRGQNGSFFPHFYGYKTNGVIQNQEQLDAYLPAYSIAGDKDKIGVGDVRFADTNGDGVIDEDDRTLIGKGTPDWTYGINIDAAYKNFDLTIFLQGAIGGEIFDYSTRNDIPRMNQPAYMLDRWHGEGTSNHLPKLSTKSYGYNWKASDLYVKSGNYIRMKNIQLGYTLPKNILSTNYIERFRVFVAAENLLTIAAYEGFDPEIASGEYTSIGVDRGIYPQSRTISVGANITF